MQGTSSTPHTLFITGAAGYVGAMLCEQYAKREDVAVIVGLDKEACPKEIAHLSKLVWVQANTADETWEDEVRQYAPTIVIHAAWHIREMYAARSIQRKWNIDGTHRLFAFACTTSSVRTLVFISSAAVYGARPDNTAEHFFTEDEPTRDDVYSYAQEKKEAEDDLRALWEKHPHPPACVIVRPSAITGPRGRYVRVRFGLQSALAGQLSGGFLNKLISTLTIIVPAPRTWARQFIHEDDVTDSIAHLAFAASGAQYAVYNITPPGEPILAREMAQVLHKKILPIHPWLIRLAFWFFWHSTRGRIPTARGAWRFYSYPILLDGTRITRETGYQYQYSSRDAFAYTNGRYESNLPERVRKSKPVQ